MSDTYSISVPPTNPYLLPADDFEALIGEIGQRAAWMRAHACPCVWSQSGNLQGRLSTPGSAQRQCRTCLGVGIYWDTPTLPFQVSMSFRHISPSPDEPGVIMDERYGVVQMSEPSLTLPYRNPFLVQGDPRQPTTAWLNASTDDIFVAIDMLARYTAKLEVGGQQILPFQQNLQVAPSGAVTIWDVATQSVVPVSGYVVSGATVTVPGSYASGTAYMVEFLAASLFVVFRRAGGLPHTRPFAGGTDNLPKAYRLQALDFWTRQRGIQPTVMVGGQVLALSIT